MRDTARSGPDRARAPERRSALPGPSHGVLALQRAIGNRAVAGTLARRPKPGPSVMLGDFGTIPLESVQHATRERDEKEIHLTSKQGEHSSRLAQAAVNGKSFPDADISVGGIHYVLENVFVSNYSVGTGAEPLESWGLSYGSLKIVHGTEGPLPE